jgi:hypothetical protein
MSPVMGTEERLRAATRAAADTVAPGSAPPLRLPPDPEGRRFPRAWFRGGRLRRRRLTALTPLAAAAAVIIVLAVAVAVAVAHSQPGHRSAARPRHHESPLAQLPPYYVALKGDGQVGDATRAQVRATATGKVLATVRPPRPYTVFSEVSGAGGGHEFVLLASRWQKTVKSGVENWFTSANEFFLLRVDPFTRVPRLNALPIPPDVFRTETGFALSQDGLKLAVAERPPPGSQAGSKIQVFNLVTGAVKTWTWPGGWPVTNGAPDHGQVLSWAADGTLAFQQRTGFSAQVRLLNTNGPGGSLKADSRLVLDWAGDAGFIRIQHGRAVNVLLGFSVLLTPSGSRIVCATTTVTEHPLTSVLSFTEYSARTGRVVRQLGSWTLHGLYPADGQDVLWTNMSGSTLIVAAHQPGLKHVRVAGGNAAGWRQVVSVVTPEKFAPLPGAPSAPGPGRAPAW